MSGWEDCQLRRAARHRGAWSFAAAAGLATLASCATAAGGPSEQPRIVRRQTGGELHGGMSRSQVEDRVGLLLLREVIGEMQVYVEPQTRCYYIFIRDFLRDWSCR